MRGGTIYIDRGCLGPVSQSVREGQAVVVGDELTVSYLNFRSTSRKNTDRGRERGKKKEKKKKTPGGKGWHKKWYRLYFPSRRVAVTISSSLSHTSLPSSPPPSLFLHT